MVPVREQMYRPAAGSGEEGRDGSGTVGAEVEGSGSGM